MKIKKIMKVLMPLGLIFGVLFTEINFNKLYNITKTQRENEIATEMTFTLQDDYNEIIYKKQFEAKDLRYYYKPSNGIFKIYDPVSNYSWYSGRDILSNEKLLATCTDNNAIECQQAEVATNPNYEHYLNSFFNVVYFSNDSSTVESIINFNSSKKKINAINKTENIVNHLRLDADFSNQNLVGINVDIQVSLHIKFAENGYDIEVRKDEIKGKRSRFISEIQISPFLGSSGGIYYSDYKNKTIALKEMTNGHVVVPDGSGSLIPFIRNEQKSLGIYTGKVYGQDLSKGYSDLRFTSKENDDLNSVVVPGKDATLPLYGIVHSDAKAAFMAYCTTGEEYLTFNVSPDNNDNYRYTYGFPSFRYNIKYFQWLNKTSEEKNQNKGAVMKKIYDYDFNMHYEFLSNDEANYSIMANKYRDYLFEQGLVKVQTQTYDNIPIRLDFLMADAQKSVAGYSNTITTSAKEVKTILNDVHDDLKIDDVVSSLYGWQNGGVTLGNPSKANFSNVIGSAKDFKSTISNGKSIGYDISLAQDYYNIYSKQISFYNTAVKHYNGYYVSRTDYLNPYLKEQGFAKADKSVSWMKNQYNTISKKVSPSSMTITGISNHIIGHDTTVNMTQSKNIIKDGFTYLDNKTKINADKPNLYLWNNTDRYFNIPITDSQYTIQGEAIPLLQMVLSGTNLEKYAEYSNFSFYNTNAMLTMVDYNVLPSFILTKEPSHLLLDTNSSDFYSTEYELYKDKINTIYSYVNENLKDVINDIWVQRTTLSNGLVVNKYQSGREIIINYLDKDLSYNNVIVNAYSVAKIGGN